MSFPHLLLALLVASTCAHSHAAPPPAQAPRPVAIHLAGDSTMAAKLASKRPETGWGEALQAQFVDGSVTVDNHARNGRSTRTFISEGRWQALLDATRAGDAVLIQFGHNDQSANKPDRYTSEADYARNLARFVADVRARGAIPVLMTPVARREFDAAGRLRETHGNYPGIVRALAARERVALIDHERRSAAVVQEAGVEESKSLFLWLPAGDANHPGGARDNTHFSPLGATRMAAEVAAALRGLDLPIAASVLPAATVR